DCLSIPDHVVRVKRHCSVSLRYQDERGRARHWQHLPPHLAELLQHEVDHLDGILMTQRASGPDAVRPIEEHAALVGAGRPKPRLSLERISEAARSIDSVFRASPQFECDTLNDTLGCRLTLKVEAANPIRSFKGRGADYFVHKNGVARPFVCASAGNWGQALAYAARARGGSLVVFAAVNANPLKVERMRRFGADVRLLGEDFDAAKHAARAYAEQTGAWMVEDGKEPEISEGAGSIAVELLAEGAAFDAVFVPLGNGALLNGIARWMKAASPATRIIGVCAEGADCMRRSFVAGSPVEGRAATIADGIGVRVPVPEAVSDMRGIVDEVRLVSDLEIIDAMRLLYTHLGQLVEPAGAAGVAAVMAAREEFANAQVATVLCGGNVTDQQVRDWIVTI
ncbi:MAG: pyridoxal-phosphate dependent enzyme, partial [Bryobacteraceae bacterium]